jgi:CspA family cold shock protein
MPKGTVKWFNSKKGYGFITPEESPEKELFVHFSGIAAKEGSTFKSLNEGDKVEYEVVDGQKGPQANNVVVTEAAPRQPRGFRKRSDEE